MAKQLPHLGAVNAAKTFCPKCAGPYTLEVTPTKTYRRCVPCHKARRRVNFVPTSDPFEIAATIANMRCRVCGAHGPVPPGEFCSRCAHHRCRTQRMTARRPAKRANGQQLQCGRRHEPGGTRCRKPAHSCQLRPCSND